jgi:hypothetical protein
MTATFGDFLRPAGEHIAAAVSIHDELPAEAAFGAICQFGRLLSTLVHYLDDLPVPDEFSAAMATEPLSPETQTVLDTRIALRRGAQSLRYDSHPAVRHLSAAVGFLAAGRDLLQTHFAISPGGTRERSSYWAPVITSPPVTAALLGEIARCTLRLAPWTARLSMPEATAGDVPAGTGLAVLTASHCTWVAGAAVQAAHRRHPPSADAHRLLYAIPANFPPPRVEPSGHEQVSALSHGAIISAERLRQAGLAFARQARWSPTATSRSWRKDALASAIIGHASEVILRGLTERARQLTLGPAICAQLHNAADASSQAWPTRLTHPARPGRRGGRSLTTGTLLAPASIGALASLRWPQSSGIWSCGLAGSPTATNIGRRPAPMPARPATLQIWPPLRVTSPVSWPRSIPQPTRLPASPLKTVKRYAPPPPITVCTCRHSRAPMRPWSAAATGPPPHLG